jgi:hypothetical protein
MVAAVVQMGARALHTVTILTGQRPLARVVVRRSRATLAQRTILATVMLKALAGGIGHDALSTLGHQGSLLCVHPAAVRAVGRADRSLTRKTLVAAIALALASGEVALATLRTVLGAGNEGAHRAHERVVAGARAVAICTSVAQSMLAAVLIAQAFVTLLAGPALLTNALEVIATSVLAALAAKFSTVGTLVLGLAAARAVVALSV